MDDRLNIDALRSALRTKGWQQVELASRLQVSEPAVSQWLAGATLPRPAMLIRLANTLGLDIEGLILQEEPEKAPLIAYRRKGQQTTTEFNEEEALDQGFALDALADDLPKRTVFPSTLRVDEVTYEEAESRADSIRSLLKLDRTGPIEWTDVIQWLRDWQVLIVPVFWGERQHHGNALHIHLPRTEHTFVFINLDSERLDFRFWLVHELAHVLTPQMVGTEEGEDFADLLAGSLLFPRPQAAEAYREVLGQKAPAKALEVMSRWALEYQVSLFTVYSQINRLAKSRGAPELKIDNNQLHAARRILDKTFPKIRVDLFGAEVPDAARYVSVAKDRFGGDFFGALRHRLVSSDEGAAFVKRCLHTSLADAMALARELVGGAAV